VDATSWIEGVNSVHRAILLVGLSALTATSALALDPPKPATPTAAPAAVAAPAVAAPAVAAPAAAAVAAPAVASVAGTLPANTDVMLRMDQELNSKSAKQGDRFNMTVVNDVLNNGLVVIPAGTRGVGEVTYRTGKGSFGKSGKMEIELKHLELDNRRIPITGKYRQEGEGGTTATVVTAVLVGVFSAFVTGKSAIVPQGRELLAQTDEPINYDPALARRAAVLPASAPMPAAAPAAAPAAVATPTS
jgi:hypothetical protein